VTGGDASGGGTCDGRVGDGGDAGGHSDNGDALAGDLRRLRDDRAAAGGSRRNATAAAGDLRRDTSAAGRDGGNDGAGAGGRSLLSGRGLNGSLASRSSLGDGGLSSRGDRNRSGDRLNTLGSGGLSAGTVGDAGSARGDGHILGLVNGVNLTVGEGGSKASEESNGGGRETHFDCRFSRKM
jgi:hypothetical protein